MRRRFRQEKARCAATSRAARDDRPIGLQRQRALGRPGMSATPRGSTCCTRTLALGGSTRKAIRVRDRRSDSVPPRRNLPQPWMRHPYSSPSELWRTDRPETPNVETTPQGAQRRPSRSFPATVRPRSPPPGTPVPSRCHLGAAPRAQHHPARVDGDQAPEPVVVQTSPCLVRQGRCEDLGSESRRLNNRAKITNSIRNVCQNREPEAFVGAFGSHLGGPGS